MGITIPSLLISGPALSWRSAAKHCHHDPFAESIVDEVALIGFTGTYRGLSHQGSTWASCDS